MTVMWFGKTSKRRKEPEYAPGPPLQQHQPSSQNSNPAPGRLHYSSHHAAAARPPSSHRCPQNQNQSQSQSCHQPDRTYAQEPASRPPPDVRLLAPSHPQQPQAQNGPYGQLVYRPSQTTLYLPETQQSPPMVTVSPPPSPPRPATSPAPPHLYHANSSPAWIPPPSGPYQYQHDPYAAVSQTYLAYQPSPPQIPGQWGPPQPSPPQQMHVHWAPPPSPPMQPEQQGFNARVNGALRKPSKMATQSLSNINDSYKQKRLQASQSVANLNDGLQRRHKMASQSVTNLHDRTNQYMAHTVALCDVISSKLDQIITSIDDEVFSGNEQELVIYEHPPEPHQSSLDVSKGNNQNIAVVASYSNHFSKVWQYSNSRLPPHLPPLKVYMPTWPLLCLAAQYSEKVYHKPTGDESETHVEPDWRHGTKAMVIKSVPVDDMNTVVFAIRGSAGFMDWAVNFRPAPTSPKGFLDDEGNLVHSGFLYVARKMIGPVAARLQALLKDNPKRSTCSLLITGHSAGGAVAALLYAHMMSTTVKSDLNRLTQLFKRVHCVTFGSPPVSLLPLKKPDSPDKKHKKSLFFGFINEGDPVVRADKEVIKNMLKLYATPAPGNCSITSVSSLALSSTSNLLSSSGKKQKRPHQTKSSSWSAPAAKAAPQWKVPPGILSCAGRLILLRDKPGSSQPPNPLSELNVEACTIVDDQLREVVFGDPMCHMMKLYARRIEVLATRAVTAGGMDLGHR